MEQEKKTSRGFSLLIVVMAVLVALSITVTAVLTNSVASRERDELTKQLEQNQSQIQQMQEQLDAQQSTLEENEAAMKEYEDTLSSLKAQLAAKKKIYSEETLPIVYLTFDDGPSDNTLKILDILKESGVTATFFVKGTSKIEYVKNIADAGHAVGLHTDTHDYKELYASDEAYFDDLTRVGNKVKDILGYVPNIIRFPGGSSNTTSKKYNEGIMTRLVSAVEEKGYSYFDWNCDSGDANGNHIPASTLLENVKKQTGNQQRVVLLMHDSGVKDTTVEALPQIIQFYKDKGYHFGKLSADIKPVHHRVNN